MFLKKNKMDKYMTVNQFKYDKTIFTEKDSNGSMYQSLESNKDLSISYKMIDGIKTVNDIQILSDNVSLDDIASYTSYTKEDLQAFNFLDNQRKVA